MNYSLSVPYRGAGFPRRIYHFATYILLVFALGLAGCSKEPSAEEKRRQAQSKIPSVADGERAVEGMIRVQSQDHILLKSFSKTDGQKSDIQGQERYEMWYAADIQFKDDCYWGPFEPDGSWSGNFIASTNPYIFGIGGAKQAVKGNNSINGHLVFYHTEEGWHLLPPQ